jgi:hypothetical protein
MHGSGTFRPTPVNQNSSIKTVANHKGVATNKVIEPGSVLSVTHEDHSHSQYLPFDKQGESTPNEILFSGKKKMPMAHTFSHKQIVDFGGIEKKTSQNVRSNGRLRAQPNYDATQLERAKMLLQKRDELPVIGMSKSQPTSLISFSEEQFFEHATSLGVSLGSSHAENIVSVKQIKDIELDRMVTMLEKK